MRTRDAGKEQLVKEQAIAMLVTDGFEGFSVNKLARVCGVSVATLYIYYKDKEDLITTIALEEAEKMHQATLHNFDPDAPFTVGLRVQWENRLRFMLDNPGAIGFFDQLRSSTYHDKVFGCITSNFKEIMGKFMKNATERGELDKMPLEVYWSVAFSPLYSLLRFHTEGRSIGGKPFSINDKIVWQTFDLVVKALKR